LAVRPELSILSLSGRLGSPNDGEPSMSITKDAREDRSGSRRVGLVTAGGLAGVAAFEMALALGAPLGRAAWGGAHAHLSAGLRIASAGAAAVWLGAALAVFGLAERRVHPFRPRWTGG
jgi:hypothetical protein